MSRLRANVEGVKDTVGELRDTIRRGESPDELLGRLGSELERLTTGESGSEGPTPPRRRENAKEATPTVDPVVSTEGRLETKVA